MKIEHFLDKMLTYVTCLCQKNPLLSTKCKLINKGKSSKN